MTNINGSFVVDWKVVAILPRTAARIHRILLFHLRMGRSSIQVPSWLISDDEWCKSQRRCYCQSTNPRYLKRWTIWPTYHWWRAVCLKCFLVASWQLPRKHQGRQLQGNSGGPVGCVPEIGLQYVVKDSLSTFSPGLLPKKLWCGQQQTRWTLSPDHRGNGESLSGEMESSYVSRLLLDSS